MAPRFVSSPEAVLTFRSGLSRSRSRAAPRWLRKLELPAKTALGQAVGPR